MNERITVRITSEMKEALDRLQREQSPPLRSRQDVVRHIMEDWLQRRGYLPPARTMKGAPGEQSASAN